MRFSGIPSGSKSIETLPPPPSDDFIIVHTCDISFDQSTRSVLARCQAIAATCDTNKQLTVSRCIQV